jgi:hypothetical protein
VHRSVAVGAQCDQILFLVLAELAAGFKMMNLQIL